MFFRKNTFKNQMYIGINAVPELKVCKPSELINIIYKHMLQHMHGTLVMDSIYTDQNKHTSDCILPNSTIC